jgi:multiple sugar transport system ATP-binding protein
MASVDILDVKKSFGAVSVIHGVSVEIRDGEFVVLVGSSGCGKSTLLRMVAGLEAITAGQIKIDGKVVNDLEPKARDIAMVFQNYALYPQMTVEQNMGFALELAGVARDERRKQVVAAAEVLGLEPLLGRYPRQLSGGQRQRVAMGRAIVRKPKVFLFDEPLSNLDAKLRVQMRGEIKELQQRLGTTTVYVTHDQVEAMTMADKIVVMNAGRIEQMGPPLELYDRPANVFVAGFLGSPAMNLIEGTVRAGPPMSMETDDHALLPLHQAPAGLAGRRVIYGVRPEHVLLDGGQGAPGQVAVVEPTGAETFVMVKVGEREITCLQRERRELRPGQEVKVSFAAAAAHFFDAASGLRL